MRFRTIILTDDGRTAAAARRPPTRFSEADALKLVSSPAVPNQAVNDLRKHGTKHPLEPFDRTARHGKPNQEHLPALVLDMSAMTVRAVGRTGILWELDVQQQNTLAATAIRDYDRILLAANIDPETLVFNSAAYRTATDPPAGSDCWGMVPGTCLEKFRDGCQKAIPRSVAGHAAETAQTYASRTRDAIENAHCPDELTGLVDNMPDACVTAYAMPYSPSQQSVPSARIHFLGPSVEPSAFHAELAPSPEGVVPRIRTPWGPVQAGEPADERGAMAAIGRWLAEHAGALRSWQYTAHVLADLADGETLPATRAGTIRQHLRNAKPIPGFDPDEAVAFAESRTKAPEPPARPTAAPAPAEAPAPEPPKRALRADPSLERLMAAYLKLNAAGRAKAAEQVEMLACVPSCMEHATKGA